MRFKSSFTIPAVVAIGFCLISGTVPAVADILHVPGDFPTIQAGIDAAVNGDEVVVADGIYIGEGNRDIDFSGKLITVRSENGPDNCIIDCEGTNDDHHRGFYFHSGETNDAVVQGFSITNSFAISGGGMYNDNSSPTVTNCTFNENTAESRGGGMFINLGSPVISDCTFTGNTAEFRGGGIYLSDGSMTVTNCTFQGNSTPVVGQHGGGAIFSRDSSVSLIECDLHENEGYHGGAVAFTQFDGQDASLTLIGCSVTNNIAVAGGGVFVHNATAILVNSTLIANQVNSDFGIGGGIVLVSDSSAVITSTTIVANSASEGGGVWMGDSSVFVRNGILWDNIPDHILGSALVRYSDVQGGWFGSGTNNIDAEPLFIDPDNGDYRISSGSLCIDAAANTYLPKGIDTDFDGNPRFIEDPNTPDTGLGDCPMVDMGSYEFQDGTADCCPWDLDGSGSVGTSDLLELFAQWGTDGPADFDGSGDVSTGDLLILFANWGPCP